MTNERAIEILNPEHREHYKSIEVVNEACRVAISTLEKQIFDDIYEKAVNKFGKTPQLIMAMEEMSELIQGLSKDIRGKRNEDNISEEIADVEIMLAQLKIIYQNDVEVEKWKTDKLFRLQAKIEEV